MAATKSAYLRSALISHVLDNTSFTTPGTVYMALYEDNPTVDDTGTEVSGGSYARQTVSWGTESGGALATDALITFSSLPATTVTHWAIHDDVSAGNMLYFGTFDIPLEMNATDDLDIATGNLQISEI